MLAFRTPLRLAAATCYLATTLLAYITVSALNLADVTFIRILSYEY